MGNIESEVIEIPALTLAIIASRINGYPIMNKSDLLKFIDEYPVVSLEILSEGDKVVSKLADVKSLKLGILNDTNISLYDAIKDNRLDAELNSSENSKKIFDAINDQFVDIENLDENMAKVIATGLEYGLIEVNDTDESRNFVDIDSTITTREVLRMLARTKYTSKYTNDIQEFEKKYNDDRMIANIYFNGNIEFDKDITPETYNTSIKNIDAVHLIIKELMNSSIWKTDIDEKSSAFMYAHKNNIISNAQRQHDAELTKYEVIDMIIKTLNANR